MLFFFIITESIFGGMIARNDILIGFVVPISVMIAVIYLGIQYVFEHRKMLIAIAEEQKE